MRLSAWVAAFLVLASSADAGLITRSTKPNGGTSWQTGDTITATPLNGDADTIYNLVNGSLDSTNLSASAGITSGQILDDTLTNADINSAAAIAYSKFLQTAAQQDMDIVDDFATNAAEFITNTSPGDTGTPSLPTNLEQEIARIRYVLRRIAVGANAKLTTGSAEANWIDVPVRSGNLMFNGDFEIKAAASPAAPDGWALNGVPTTVQQAETAVTMGEGKEINIVARASNADGITYTLAGLKASTNYVVSVWAKAATASDTCALATSGAAAGTFGDVSLSTQSTTYVPLVAMFATDATPTNIVINLIGSSNAQADDCDFDHAGVFEANADPVALPGALAQTVRVTASQTITATAYAAVTNATTAVTVPGPGYWIETVFDGSANRQAGSSNEDFAFQIKENGTACAIKTDSFQYNDEMGSISLHCVNTAPTVGATYTYTVEAKISADSMHICSSADEGDCRITTRLVKGD